MLKRGSLLFGLMLVLTGTYAPAGFASVQQEESSGSVQALPKSRQEVPQASEKSSTSNAPQPASGDSARAENISAAPSEHPVLAPRPRVSEVSNWPVVLLGLLGIIALILLVAWLLKRLGGLNAMGMRGMKVLAVLPLGAREKVALIDVNGQQLLLGVTSQNINLLHTFDQPIFTENEMKGGNDFASKLQGLLARQPTTQDHD